MRVLIISKYDNDGGAAIAAHRLHLALKELGKDSLMIVHKKRIKDPSIIEPKSIFKKFLSKLTYYIDQVPVFFYKKKSKYLFTPGWYSPNHIIDEINSFNADIVNIHWSSKGMISIKDFSRINAPVVFTMHDSWAFTGGCHIPFDCKKYIDNCGKCPQLNSKIATDLSYKSIIKKTDSYNSKSNISFVAVSKWLEECAKESHLLNKKNVHRIPNALDTNIFRPLDKNQSKAHFGFKTNKRIILFGALSATSDINKGYKELCTALNKLHISDVEVVIFGSSRPKEEMIKNFKTHYLGNINEYSILSCLYNASDVTVVPSKMESFGQTASEALSCGTPVVAFNATGLKDIIDHKINGYLASPYSSSDLANGIQWVLNNNQYDKLVKNSRKKAMNKFDSFIVAKQYIKLYESII